MMSFVPAQSRAARALLNWSQANLASASGVATKTVADFERQERSPYPRTLADIQRALEAAGVEFSNGGQPGVKLKPWSEGQRVRLRPLSASHAMTLGIGSDEIATVERLERHPGDPPWGRIDLRRASGEIVRGLDRAHFERVA
jgi:transcriptional regulator with XRE-family HTH domain